LDFDKPEGATTPYGLAYTTGKYWTFMGRIDRLISIDETTGAVSAGFPMTNSSGAVDKFWGSGGVAAIGSELFVLGEVAGSPHAMFVRVYSTSGTFLREWEYKEVGWSASNPLVYKPCIGASSTRIYIAHCDDGGQLIWRTYDKTTGALL